MRSSATGGTSGGLLRGWLALAMAELGTEALEQNHEDGVNKEQAVWYHAAVADMLLQ